MMLRIRYVTQIWGHIKNPGPAKDASNTFVCQKGKLNDRCPTSPASPSLADIERLSHAGSPKHVSNGLIVTSKGACGANILMSDNMSIKDKSNNNIALFAAPAYVANGAIEGPDSRHPVLECSIGVKKLADYAWLGAVAP